MRMLAIYNGTNKRFRRDGDEFEREAEAWCEAQPHPPGGDNIWIKDVRDGRIRAEIRKMTDGLDVLAIFDHGTPKGLPRMRESYKCVKGLAETIAGVTDKITIILYSCSCGKGWWWGKFRWLRWRKNKRDIDVWDENYNPRDGYAVVLARELMKLGVEAEVWAHLTWGHCCRLPHVAKIMENDGDTCRRRWVYPKDKAEWKQWKADMRGPKRFTFWRD